MDLLKQTFKYNYKIAGGKLFIFKAGLLIRAFKQNKGIPGFVAKKT